MFNSLVEAHEFLMNAWDNGLPVTILGYGSEKDAQGKRCRVRRTGLVEKMDTAKKDGELYVIIRMDHRPDNASGKAPCRTISNPKVFKVRPATTRDIRVDLQQMEARGREGI